MSAYSYTDVQGRNIHLNPCEVVENWDGVWTSLTDEQKEQMAGEASKRDRKYALIRAIRSMYSAGERHEALDIVKREFRDDLHA